MTAPALEVQDGRQDREEGVAPGRVEPKGATDRSGVRVASSDPKDAGLCVPALLHDRVELDAPSTRSVGDRMAASREHEQISGDGADRPFDAAHRRDELSALDDVEPSVALRKRDRPWRTRFRSNENAP